MAKILEFSSMDRKKDDDRDSSARDAAIAEVNKQRLRNIKARLDQRPRMSKGSERATIATNLWRLLERLENSGIKKSQVVRSWRPGSETDSTKRLYTYILPPDLPEPERSRREEQLTQKITGYRALAEHAAKLAGRDADLFLDEILRGTGYESQDNSLLDESNSPWVVYMRDLLVKMCNWIAIRNDLNGYFSQISEQGLSVSDNLAIGVHGNRISHLKFDELIHREHLGECIPSILLIRKELQRFHAEMLVSGRGSTGEALRPGGSIDSAERCMVESYSELYLSIAPLGKDKSPVGVFETRIKTDITVGQKICASFEDYYDNYDGEKSDPLDDWRLVWCPEEDEDGLEGERYPVWIRPIETKQTVFGKTGVALPASTISRDPLVSVTGCRVFQEIDRFNVYNILGAGIDWEVPVWALGLDEFSSEVYVESPSGTLAHVTEKNLYVDDVENRLDSWLDRCAASLTQQVQTYVQERREKFEKRKLEILKRYEI